MAYEKYDLEDHLTRQSKWSQKTFGPGARTNGVCDHIQMELVEISASPNDIMEWIDVIILAFDGALRSKFTPFAIANCISASRFVVESSKEATDEILGYLDAIRDGNAEAFLDVATMAAGELSRQGWPREAVWHAMAAKQLKNEARKWPDWRELSETERSGPITHID